MSPFNKGDYTAVCDVCGFEFKASQLRRRWDNLRVCEKDYEERHPQDLLRAKRERNVPWARPEAPDTFIDSPFIEDENNECILDSNEQHIRAFDMEANDASL